MPDEVNASIPAKQGLYEGVPDPTYRTVDALSQSVLKAWPSSGIHHNIDFDEYFKLHGFSKSWMGKLRVSPAHLWDYLNNPKPSPTKEQIFGNACHTALLEPDKFDSRYVVGPDVRGNTNEYKEFKKESEFHGQHVLSAADNGRVQTTVKSIRANSIVKKILQEECWTETSLVFDRNKYVCKARVDLAVPKHRLIADLKTTRDGSESGFAREIYKYNYHTQAAWYMDAASLLTGDLWDTFWFIAAEKRRPFCVSIHEIKRDSEAYAKGKKDYEEMFELYVRCAKTNTWPGYGEDIFTVELPDWKKEIDVYEEPFD